MNEGIHLDLDTWIVPGQIRKANLTELMLQQQLMLGVGIIIKMTS